MTRGRPVQRILYGLHPVLEAMNAGRRILEVLIDRGARHPELKRIASALEEQGVPCHRIARTRLRQMCGSSHHQGIAAKVEALRNASLSGLLKDRGEQGLTVLLLDGVQDPQNLGSIYRGAEAAGVDLLFLPSRGAASHQLGSVSRASAGAVEHVPSVVVGNLKSPIAELRGAGFLVLALEQEAEESLWDADLPERVALVVGGEGKGISPRTKNACDRVLAIPMQGKVASLNVAQAAVVALFEVARRRAAR